MGANGIVGPNDIVTAGADLGGANINIIAELPRGGWIQVVEGESPLGVAVPGPHVAPGSMLAVIPPELAEHMRGVMRQVRANAAGINGHQPKRAG